MGCGRIGYEAIARDESPGFVDAASTDAASTDGTSIDAAQAPLGCELGADSSTVALYTFDSDPVSVIRDEVTGNPGTLVGSPSYSLGAEGRCGQALVFGGNAAEYALIANSLSWELGEGSVDFWFRIDALPDLNVSGLVSRDAAGSSEAGHLTFVVTSTGRLVSRFQEQNTPGSVKGTCSPINAITVGEWNHVGLNFGTGVRETWLNGSLVDAAGTFMMDDRIFTCQENGSSGLRNSNPWVLGASSIRSADGVETPLTDPLNGAVDFFRISDRPRDFSGIEFRPLRLRAL